MPGVTDRDADPVPRGENPSGAYTRGGGGLSRSYKRFKMQDSMIFFDSVRSGINFVREWNNIACSQRENVVCQRNCRQVTVKRHQVTLEEETRSSLQLMNESKR